MSHLGRLKPLKHPQKQLLGNNAAGQTSINKKPACVFALPAFFIASIWPIEF